ncbi:MAG: SDR family NAD(P)-dependent oxidoreductase [Actinomycetota bacterium]
MKHFAGKVVAVTGAASGIGRALAVGAVGRGAHVALADVDTDGLAETAALAEGRGSKVSTRRVDVADRDELVGWADEVAAEHGAVNVIINNAGVALAASAADQSPDDFDWLMKINFWGVVNGTQAFLPHLRRTGDGHVVNISSVFGLFSVPTQSAYNASKFGVRGYTDALRMELEIERAGVSATTIHPGGIKTSIARNARVDPSASVVGGSPDEFGADFDQLARTTPEKAARQILNAVERNRRRALIGPDAKVFDLVSRLPAGVYQRALIWEARRRRR